MLHNKKEKIKINCLECNKSIHLLPSRAKLRKFCSSECGNKHQRGRKKIGNYKPNSGSFKKGQKSWIKGKETPKSTNYKQVIYNQKLIE